jgi:hypothetical protein
MHAVGQVSFFRKKANPYHVWEYYPLINYTLASRFAKNNPAYMSIKDNLLSTTVNPETVSHAQSQADPATNPKQIPTSIPTRSRHQSQPDPDTNPKQIPPLIPSRSRH